jgi:hypothetical protein
VFCDDPITALLLVDNAVWVAHNDGSVVIRHAEVLESRELIFI